MSGFVHSGRPPRAPDSGELFTPNVMVQRSKTVSGVRTQQAGERAGLNGARECGAAEGAQGHLQGMVSEVVSLLNEQAFAQGRACTEREVCESFSEILLRHWNLCCVKIYLREEGGALAMRAAFTHPHVDGEGARVVGETLAEEVARTGDELAVGLGGNGEGGGADPGAEAMLARAGFGAAAAVPISASGALA